MNMHQLTNIFITTVGDLIEYRLSNGSKIFIETKGGRFINFKPNSFRNKLQNVAGTKEIKEYMKNFKTLGWIITGNDDRFTNTQWINKKSIRVISIDRAKYELLKELLEK